MEITEFRKVYEDSRKSTSVFDQAIPLINKTPFSLNRYLFRYLAGDISLREARSVSRKRLALAESNLPSQDRDAQKLVRQIESYEQAYLYLKGCETITLEALCKTNQLAEPNKKGTGTLRTGAIWIGGKTNRSNYVPPQARKVKPLIDDLICFINDDAHKNDYAKACAAHAQLVAIHPFVDGNGRVARILWQVIAEKSGQQFIPPFIYRLHNPSSQYIRAISAYGIESRQGIGHTFWSESFLWGEHLKGKINLAIEQCQKKIEPNIPLLNTPHRTKEIIASFWRKPIQNPLTHTKDTGVNFFTTQDQLNIFFQNGILALRNVRYPEGGVVIECNPITNLFNEIEGMIFSQNEG